jgi:hypothetical protein
MFNLLKFVALLGAPAKVRKATVRRVCPFVYIEQQSANWKRKDSLKRDEFETA